MCRVTERTHEKLYGLPTFPNLFLFDHSVSLPGICVRPMESYLLAVVNKPAVGLFLQLCYRAIAKAILIATLLGTA